MDDEAWYDEVRETLETAYLGSDDPRGQSGFRGDTARWERGRRVIAEAIDCDGSFLDIGCANGHLLETLVPWAERRDHRIEPYGLDLSTKLVDLAKSRLPNWAERFFVGNAMIWNPPCRFDFVRTNLEFVPVKRRLPFIERLLADLLTPGGRLIVCSYGSATRPDNRVEPIVDHLRDWGFEVAGEAESADLNGVVITRVAWIDAPRRR